MKKYLIPLMAGLAITCGVALAADIDGKWTREQAGRGGGTPTTQTLTLTSKGTTLTGTLDAGGGRGGPVEIKDGKVEGNNVTFNIVQDFGGNSVTRTYKGTVSGKELKLTVEGGGGGGGGKGGGGGGGGKGGGGGPQEQTWTKQ
jgi:hypothetical protein